jgi:hypothetical protein
MASFAPLSMTKKQSCLAASKRTPLPAILITVCEPEIDTCCMWSPILNDDDRVVFASWNLHPAVRRLRDLEPTIYFLGGAFTTGQTAQRAPQKKHGPASRRPRPSAESAPLSLSRSTACRRDPRRRRTQYPSCYLRQAPRRRQTHWRVTSNWPPSPCPLHGATRPLPTPVEPTFFANGADTSRGGRGPGTSPVPPPQPPPGPPWRLSAQRGKREGGARSSELGALHRPYPCPEPLLELITNMSWAPSRGLTLWLRGLRGE